MAQPIAVSPLEGQRQVLLCCGVDKGEPGLPRPSPLPATLLALWYRDGPEGHFQVGDCMVVEVQEGATAVCVVFWARGTEFLWSLNQQTP